MLFTPSMLAWYKMTDYYSETFQSQQGELVHRNSLKIVYNSTTFIN